MEDYSPSPGEVEETPQKKRRFLRGNFLRSWLEKRQNEPNHLSTQENSNDDNDQEVSTWRPERLRDRLRSVFSGLVTLEPVEPTERQAGATEAHEQPSIYAEASPLEPEEEEGLLAVSPDAQRRYYGYELMDEPGLDQEEIEDESELEVGEHEYSGLNSQESTYNRANLGSGSSPRAVESVSEVMRRRQAERLEKRVKRLKKRTNTIKKEQEEVIKEQRGFAKKLAEKDQAQEKFEQITVPNMEKARKRLQQRLETQPSPVVVKTEADRLSTVETSPAVPLAPRTEQRVDNMPTYETPVSPVKSETAVKLDEILKTKELATDSKITSERIYERRHEVMDTEDANNNNLPKAVSGVSSGSTSGPNPFPPPLVPLSIMDQSKRQSVPKDTQSFAPGTSMYKQAMRMGFWSGIGLTVLLLAVLMFMR